ncbi:flagellar biosynthesis protein FlhF [Paenibacillus septentrionalis]|uniref:Flagellar biosynthesis protein FlhF n=1 Tax=Paenibacillus septentrionalis TaxID=429342 RepID=A0ABW1V0C2_9BACL
MRVKRYVVDALSDAVPLIRNELGKDAIILESKEVKIGGFMGMFRKRKLEVLAAVEPQPEKQGNKGASKKLDAEQVDLVIEQILKASKKSKPEEAGAAAAVTASTRTSTAANGQIKELDHPNASFASRLYSVGATQAQSQSTAKQDIQEEKLPAPSSKVLAYNEEVLQASKPMSSTEQFIVNELKNLRQEMVRLAQKGGQHETLPSEAILALQARLEEQELDKQWVEMLSEALIQEEIERGEQLDIESVWSKSKERLLEWLTPYQHGVVSANTHTVQFVGPTGVGKTTTIAKLAANFSIKEGKKLGLITADTYRIAAVEQLRTYANILNIPLEVVFSPLELERALTSLEHTELILMDTAGRNFKSDLHVSEVNSLLPQQEQSESVLVLSLTSRTADMRIIAEKFSKYGIRKVVFTKLDETSVYGAIFNMVLMFGLTPLFITSGQNVPDDISPFHTEKYIELLLGEPPHE